MRKRLALRYSIFKPRIFRVMNSIVIVCQKAELSATYSAYSRKHPRTKLDSEVDSV